MVPSEKPAVNPSGCNNLLCVVRRVIFPMVYGARTLWFGRHRAPDRGPQGQDGGCQPRKALSCSHCPAEATFSSRATLRT